MNSKYLLSSRFGFWILKLLFFVLITNTGNVHAQAITLRLHTVFCGPCVALSKDLFSEIGYNNMKLELSTSDIDDAEAVKKRVFGSRKMKFGLSPRSSKNEGYYYKSRYFDFKEINTTRKFVRDSLYLFAIDTVLLNPNLLTSFQNSKIVVSHNNLGILNYFKNTIHIIDLRTAKVKDSIILASWELNEYWDKFDLVPKKKRSEANVLLSKYLMDKCTSSVFGLQSDTLVANVNIPYVYWSEDKTNTFIAGKSYLFKKEPNKKPVFSELSLKNSTNSMIGLPILDKKVYVFSSPDSSLKHNIRWRTHSINKGFKNPVMNELEDSVMLNEGRHVACNTGYVCNDSTAFDLRTKEKIVVPVPTGYAGYNLFYYSKKMQVFLKSGKQFGKNIVLVTAKGVKVFESDTWINISKVYVNHDTVYYLDKVGLIKIKVVDLSANYDS